MQLKTILALFAMAMPAWADIEFTSVIGAVQAGQTYTLTWATTDTGPVSIILKDGSATNLQTVMTVTNQGTGGTYVWTAPENLADGSYALQISSGQDVNYSGFFSYTGGTGTASSAAASSGASSAATATATSAASSAATSGVITSIASQTTGTTATTATSATTTPKSLTTKASSSSPPTATASSVPTGAATALGVAASPIALVLGAAFAMAIV